MVSTRNKILAFLANRGPASAVELSHALKLTAANIRHHLQVLQNEGVVIPIQTTSKGNRGRPARLYGLIDHKKAHNLDRLCAAILLQIRATASPIEKKDLLRSIAHQLVADRSTPPATNLTQRLIHAAKTLNQMSYKASWEAHREAPTIKFAHCPYASIVDSFPELCQMDIFLLEKLMQCPVELLATRQPTGSGEHICRFRLRQSTPESVS